MDKLNVKRVSLIGLLIATMILILLLGQILMVEKSEAGYLDSLSGNVIWAIIYLYPMLLIISVILFFITAGVKTRFDALAKFLIGANCATVITTILVI